MEIVLDAVTGIFSFNKDGEEVGEFNIVSGVVTVADSVVGSALVNGTLLSGTGHQLGVLSQDGLLMRGCTPVAQLGLRKGMATHITDLQHGHDLWGRVTHHWLKHHHSDLERIEAVAAAVALFWFTDDFQLDGPGVSCPTPP